MEIPRERGPLCAWVAARLRGSRAGEPSSPSAEAVVEDADAQLALWMLYELHYQGFDGVPASLEWDPELIGLRVRIEEVFEARLRSETADVVDRHGSGDIGEQLLELAGSGSGRGVAWYLQRRADRAQMVDYLRERSVQQLKESDPQSFVLPRLDGPAKVALAEVQYDEYGGGRPDRMHATLYAQAMAGAGLDPAYGAYIDEVSAVTLAAANLMSLFALNRRLRGAAMGHLAVFEATSSVPCRRISAGLERLGFPQVVRAYFDEHVLADAVHEQIAARDICGVLVAADPGQRQEVLFGAAACLYLDEMGGSALMQRWSGRLQEVS